jgi:acetyl-CoA C-acetyltransferase
MANREVVFVEGMRTAFGRLGGSLKDISSEELGSIALKGIVDKTKICAMGHLDSVFAGSAFPVSNAIRDGLGKLDSDISGKAAL